MTAPRKRLDLAAVKRGPKAPDPRHVRRVAELLLNGRNIAEAARGLGALEKRRRSVADNGQLSALARALGKG